MVNSAHLGITANECCFETGCFVYHENGRQNLSNCKHCSKLDQVTNHKLAGSKLQHACCSRKNLILNENN